MTRGGVANCYGCGRFCRVTSYEEYDGTWMCLYVTTHCKECGEIERSET